MFKWSETGSYPHPDLRHHQARAYSVAAYKVLRLFEQDSAGTNIKTLAEAAFYANFAAHLGLVSLAVIRTAHTIVLKGLLGSEYRPAPELQQYVDQLKGFGDLARVWRRWFWIDGPRCQQAGIQVIRGPGAPPQCAQCALEATQYYGLLPCPGNCPADRKPRYCSFCCFSAVSVCFQFYKISSVIIKYLQNKKRHACEADLGSSVMVRCTILSLVILADLSGR